MHQTLNNSKVLAQSLHIPAFGIWSDCVRTLELLSV